MTKLSSSLTARDKYTKQPTVNSHTKEENLKTTLPYTHDTTHRFSKVLEKHNIKTHSSHQNSATWSKYHERRIWNTMHRLQQIVRGQHKQENYRKEVNTSGQWRRWQHLSCSTTQRRNWAHDKLCEHATEPKMREIHKRSFWLNRSNGTNLHLVRRKHAHTYSRPRNSNSLITLIMGN